MRSAAMVAVVTLGVFGLPLARQNNGPIQIPKEGEGYQITKTDASQPAPAGYEGRTDTSTQTAVGNTPATAGKRFVTHFTLGNQIKTCPQADGTAEGTGTFSISVDYTDAQANATTTLHIEMRADAKYKGQVGDDAHLQGPVTAEIDYTYNQTGRTRNANGAITTPPPVTVSQHITIPIVVAKDLAPSGIGAFSGGDPTQGHYSDAFGVGLALTYWGGIYYSTAQIKWLQGQCAQIVFAPPGNTLQPVLGGKVTVTAEVKTKGGESAKAHFVEAHARSGGGSVDPGAGLSDVGSPMKFTYTAPNQKVATAGFTVEATSPAGVAHGEWMTGLGTGWSGVITCTKITKGDEGHDVLQTWSSSEAMQLTIIVKDGVGTATGYAETKGVSENRQGVAHNGAITYINDSSQSWAGTADATTPVALEVRINKTTNTYEVVITDMRPFKSGQQRSVMCRRDGCTTTDLQLTPDPGYSNPEGPLDDSNHVHGTKSSVQSNLGRTHHGTMTWTLTWDLARQGTTK